MHSAFYCRIIVPTRSSPHESMQRLDMSMHRGGTYVNNKVGNRARTYRAMLHNAHAPYHAPPPWRLSPGRSTSMQRARVLEQARRSASPQKNDCDKQVSSGPRQSPCAGWQRMMAVSRQTVFVVRPICTTHITADLAGNPILRSFLCEFVAQYVS